MATQSRNTSDQLPGEGLVDRWTSARKAEVLRRIHVGEITRGDAMRRWKISVEEMDAWLTAHRRAGQKGLKVTAIPQGRLL